MGIQTVWNQIMQQGDLKRRMLAKPAPSIEALAVVGEAAIVAEKARKARAAARTELSRQRRAWLSESGSYYDAEECRGVDGAEEMELALRARSAAQVDYRRASSRLRAAIAKATP